ncbi:MAG: PAS domain S-box protein, partial [Proteobacteria bacterium]|nr:PAS domain S-box protein [Pseudomonadota bacterium]
YPDALYRHTVISTWIDDLKNVKKGEKRPRTYTVTCKDGTKKIINFVPVQLKGGENFVACEDITEQKEAEQALRENEARYRALFESANDAIFIMKYDKFIDCNTQTLLMFGCTKEQIINQTPYRFSPLYQPDGRNSKEKALEKINDALLDKPQFFEWQHCKYDGTLFDTEVSLNCIEVGDEIFTQAIVRDITERKQIEESMQKERETFFTILENDPSGVALIGRDGVYKYLNLQFTNITGYTIEDVPTGKDWFQKAYPDPEYRKKVIETWKKNILPEGKSVDEEFKVTCKDGQSKDIEFRTTFLKDSAITVLNDITERRQSEQKLKESEERYRNIFENAVEGIFQTTPEGRFLSVNPALARMMGFSSPEEMVATFTDIAKQHYVNPQDRVKYKKLLEEYGTAQAFETQLYCKDGRKIWVSINARAVRGKNGNILYYEGTIEDITERKMAVEELLIKDYAIESSINPIFFADLEGNLTYVNSSFLNLWGYKDDKEVLGKSVIEFSPNKEGVLQILKIVKEVGEWSGELIARKKDESTLDIQLSIAIVKDKNGRPACIMVSLIDITERKRTEEKLQNTMENLHRAMGATIQAIVSTVETRDPYTAGHQKRVSNLARAIAKEMDLSDVTIDGIRMVGAIHDIGKISIPAEILSKPGKLSEIEFGLIKTHSQIGYNILKDIEFPWPIAHIILQHHERLNGSGYPRGLKGEDILLEARILAVADVVEAMASHRPYRPTLGLDAALKEISQNKGILYDKDVVEVCWKLFREKGFSFDEKRD